jgi:hypothetical protein
MADESRLHRSYNISDFVILHFQDPKTESLDGDDVAIYERMLMAGFRFSFPVVVQELASYLGVTPS